jgi:hypothetical protein
LPPLSPLPYYRHAIQPSNIIHQKAIKYLLFPENFRYKKINEINYGTKSATWRCIMRRGAKRFGETSQFEREIIAEIIFRREVKKQSLAKIADDLNAQCKWPRRAPKWSWILMRHVYECNKPGK